MEHIHHITGDMAKVGTPPIEFLCFSLKDQRKLDPQTLVFLSVVLISENIEV